MTSVSYLKYGEEHQFDVFPADILRGSLDDFLKADNLGAELRSIISLSIVLEIFIKKELHAINSILVDRKLQKENLEEIIRKAQNTKNLIQKRKFIIDSLSKLPKSKNVIKFDFAIMLFPIFKSVPKRIINLIDDLRIYRNGLFHWEADPASLFGLSLRSLDLYLWLFAYLKKKIGHWLGQELNILDSDGKKRKELEKLKSLRKSERLFNPRRRLLKCKAEYSTFCRIRAHIDGIVTRPSGMHWPRQRCPACQNETLQVEDWRSKNKHGKKIGVFAVVCTICDAFLTEDELDRINPINPGLRQIAKSLGISV